MRKSYRILIGYIPDTVSQYELEVVPVATIMTSFFQNPMIMLLLQPPGLRQRLTPLRHVQAGARRRAAALGSALL